MRFSGLQYYAEFPHRYDVLTGDMNFTWYRLLYISLVGKLSLLTSNLPSIHNQPTNYHKTDQYLSNFRNFREFTDIQSCGV